MRPNRQTYLRVIPQGGDQELGALTDRPMPLSPGFAAPRITEVLNTFLNKLITFPAQTPAAHAAFYSRQLTLIQVKDLTGAGES